MEQKISNPMPAGPATSPPLPQHTVELTPPRTVKRKGSVAEMLMRLTTHTAASRGKMRDTRSASSPQQTLKSSQSMRSLRVGSGSPVGAGRSHARTLSNPGSMPPISRPIALPVGFSPTSRYPSGGAARAAGARSPGPQSRGSSSPSLLSDSSGGSARSGEHSHSNASSSSLGTPRRPAPLPPSQAMSTQPRTKRGPGALASPPRNPRGPRKTGATPPRPPPANASSKPGLRSPALGAEPLSITRTRKTPKKDQQVSARASPEYVKRSPRIPGAEKGGAVGLGLDLGTKPVHKRVASAPAPPAGYTATKPRSMSQIMQLQQQHELSGNQQDSPKLTQPLSSKEPLKQSQAKPPGQLPLRQRQPSPAGLAQRQHPHTKSQPATSPQYVPEPQQQPQGRRAISKTQQMRERLAELQSLTRQPPESKALDPKTPVLQQTGFSTYPSPTVSPLNTPGMGTSSNGFSPLSPGQGKDQAQEITALRQKLSRLEVRYNVLKEQREQDVLNLQSVSAELNIVQASRDSLQQQVSAHQLAQQDMQQRIDSLQRKFVRSQRLVRVLGANLEDFKVALEEKNMENYALKRTASRAARPKLYGGVPAHNNEGGMLSPPNSISDAGDMDQDSDTPTIRE